MPDLTRRNAPASAPRASATSQGPSGGAGNAHAADMVRGKQGESTASGGVMGWFRKAGDWVSDKYDQTAGAVGDFVDRTGKAAGEMYEAWSSTDFSYENGKIGMDTDLDEVMDLLPQGARDTLALDKSDPSKNKVKVEFDTKTKVLTVRSPDLRIAGVNRDGLTTGPASLQGVVITVSNHGGGIPFLDGKFSFFGKKDKDDNVAVDVAVQRVVAADVSFQGPKGPVSAAEIELGGFHVNAANKGGVPFGEKGVTTASFDVKNAKLRGVSADDTQVASVAATDLSGGLHQSAETAYLEAGAVSVDGFKQGDTDLGSATVEGVRADIRNQGGGMPFLDKTPDQLSAAVSVSSGRVSDVGAGRGRASRASFEDLDILHSAMDGSTSVKAKDLKASGLDTDDVDAAEVDLDDFALDTQAGRTSAAFGAAKVSGLDTKSVDADELVATNARVDAQGGNAKASLGGLAAKGLVTAQGRIGSASASGIEAEVAKTDAGTHVAGSVSSLGARDVSAGGATVSSVDASKIRVGADITDKGPAVDVGVGQLDARGVAAGGFTVDHAGVSDAAVTQAAGHTTASASKVSASGIDGGAHHVGTISASDVSVDKGDALSARAAELSASDVKSGELAAQSLSARGAHVETGKETTLGADSLGLKGFQAKNLEVGEASATGASARLGSDGMSASLEGADLKDATVAGRLGVSQATVSDVSATQSGDLRTVHLGGASAKGITDAPSGVKVDSASITGLDTRNDAGVIDAKLDSARVAGVSAGGTRVDAASVSGLTGSRDASGDAALGVAKADATGVSVHTDKLDASLASASLGGLGARTSGKETRVDLATGKLVGLDASSGTARGSATSADVSGLSATHGPKGTSASVKGLGATGVEVGTDGLDAKIGSVDVSGAKVDAGKTVSASADRAAASGVSFTKAPGQGGESGPGLDTASLIRTASHRVDDIDANLSVPMKTGEYSGGLDVEKPSQLDASLQVRDNQVTDKTKASFSNPVDGPLWTSVRGLYVKDGEAKADVAGFFDQSVSKQANKGLGLKGSDLHSLGTYGDAAAAKMGTAAPGRPGREGKPGLDQAFDWDKHRADARIGLSPGEIDAGSMKASLKGENTVDVKSVGGQELVVSFARFLTSALSLDVGGQSLDTGNASLTQTKVAVDQGGADKGTVTGTIGSVSVEGVKYGK